MALALYRKYRPATFSEVVGQEHVTDPLRTALAAGRVNHAYLFSGPRGCGKTSSARIMARSLNCVEGPTPDPCGVCPSCIALAPEGPGSLDVVELDAASHGGVDDTRDLRDRAFYMPAESRYRVFIIDEAHMVSPQGFNALLKIVEEPPEHLVFIFATTEPDKVMTTIRSRTHHYPFRLIPPATLRKLLEKLCREENVTVEPAVFPLVIRAGGGSARDSLSILDQLLAGAGPEGVTYASAVALLGVTDASLLDEMVDALAAGDGASVFGAVDKVVEAGHDPRRFAADLLQRLRDLVIIAAVPDAGAKGLIDAPEDQVTAMYGQSERLGASTLTRLADVMHTGLVDMRGTTSPRLVLELMCARMLLPATASGEGAMLQRLERLEQALSSGVALTGVALTGGTGTGVAASSGGGVMPSANGTAADGQGGRSKPAYRRPSLRSDAETGAAVPPTEPASTEPPAPPVAPDPTQAVAPASEDAVAHEVGTEPESLAAVVGRVVAAADVSMESDVAPAVERTGPTSDPTVADPTAAGPATDDQAVAGPTNASPTADGQAGAGQAVAGQPAVRRSAPEPVQAPEQPAARASAGKAAAALGLPTPPVLSGAARTRLSGAATSSQSDAGPSGRSTGAETTGAPTSGAHTGDGHTGDAPTTGAQATAVRAHGSETPSAETRSAETPVVLASVHGSGDAAEAPPQPSVSAAPPASPTAATAATGSAKDEPAAGTNRGRTSSAPVSSNPPPAVAEPVQVTTAAGGDDDWPAPPEPPMDDEYEYGPPDPGPRRPAGAAAGRQGTQDRVTPGSQTPSGESAPPRGADSSRETRASREAPASRETPASREALASREAPASRETPASRAAAEASRPAVDQPRTHPTPAAIPASAGPAPTNPVAAASPSTDPATATSGSSTRVAATAAPAKSAAATSAPNKPAAANSAPPAGAGGSSAPPNPSGGGTKPDASAMGVTDVRRLWAEVLTAVQRRRRTTQILLESATVADVRDGALYLTMPSPGMARRVVEAANADLLRQALREVMGVDWAIRCDAAGEAPPSRPSLRLVSNEPDRPAAAEEDDTPEEYNPNSPDPTAGQFAPRDPEEVAIELLTQELGATKIE